VQTGCQFCAQAQPQFIAAYPFFLGRRVTSATVDIWLFHETKNPQEPHDYPNVCPPSSLTEVKVLPWLSSVHVTDTVLPSFSESTESIVTSSPSSELAEYKMIGSSNDYYRIIHHPRIIEAYGEGQCTCWVLQEMCSKGCNMPEMFLLFSLSKYYQTKLTSLELEME
jgi:hypothetical protein